MFGLVIVFSIDVSGYYQFPTFFRIQQKKETQKDLWHLKAE